MDRGMAPLVHSLSDLSDLVSFAIIEVLFLLAVIVLPRVLRRPVRRLGLDSAAGNIVDTFKIVISLTGILLTFLLVQAYGNLRSAEELTVREASAINSVDRGLLRYGDPRAAALRPMLLDYARAITDDEWKSMTLTRRSEKADHFYTEVSRPARALTPQTPREQTIFTEIVRGLDDVSDLRETRLGAAGMALPGFFWSAVTCLFLLLAVLASLVEPSLERAFTLGGMTAAIGMLFSLVVVVDEPFHGEDAIKPAAIKVMIART
jgi:hypothetical protein